MSNLTDTVTEGDESRANVHRNKSRVHFTGEDPSRRESRLDFVDEGSKGRFREVTHEIKESLRGVADLHK